MNGLFGSTILEVAIGMALVYLLLAVFCTAANEWIAWVLKARSDTLERGLKRLLEGQDSTVKNAAGETVKLVDTFYAHPLIRSLMHDDQHPAYVTPRNFAGALMDLVTPQNAGTITFADLENGIRNLPAGNVRTTMLALVQNVDGDLGRAQTAIEGWFNDSMSRVSAVYKRRTQVWTLVVASLLTIATNADTVQLAQKLWMEPALRGAVEEMAKTRATQTASTQASDPELAEMGHLIGWQGEAGWTWVAWLERILGWLLTVCAVSLGAPFWFDTLNRFVNIRAAGRRPGET